MNPAKDGLPAVKSREGKTAEWMLLSLGVEAMTNNVRKGYEIPAADWRFIHSYIQRVEGLKAALDHREEMQGGNDD